MKSRINLYTGYVLAGFDGLLLVGMVLALGLGIMFMLFSHSSMTSELRKYYDASAPNLHSLHYDQSTATSPHDLWAQVSGSEIAICDHHAALCCMSHLSAVSSFPFLRSRLARRESLSAIAKQNVGWELVPRGRFQGGRLRRGDFLGSPRLGLLGLFIVL
jgi:hypothetical protein